MYFVDRRLLEQRLMYFEKQVSLLSDTKSWDDEVDKLALERISHLIIEIIIDVGNQMIDGFIMRDPGSYDDVIDILVDERVISAEEGTSFKAIIAWRKTLLQNYIHVEHEDLLETLTTKKEAIVGFPTKVRLYLENELGPVSAFLPEND